MTVKQITLADVDFYKEIIEKENVDGVIAVYDVLQKKFGSTYAGWAKGVAKGDSVTGQSALYFMKDSFVEKSGKILSPAQTDKIRKEMAQAYLEEIRKNINEPNSELPNPVDITYKQLHDFHKKVFDYNDLSIDNWTLKTPMELLAKINGDKEAIHSDKVERVWQLLSKTDGTGLDSLLGSLGLTVLSTKIAYAPEVDRLFELAPVPVKFIWVAKKTYEILAQKEGEDEASLSANYYKIDRQDIEIARQWLKNVSIAKPFFEGVITDVDQEVFAGTVGDDEVSDKLGTFDINVNNKLYGGKGFDTYRTTGGDDIIIDEDMVGEVVLANGVKLTPNHVFKQLDSGTGLWVMFDEENNMKSNFKARRQNNDLVLDY